MELTICSSFGHFEAQEYDIANGMLHKEAKRGISLVRNSVQRLNLSLIDACSKLGLPVVTLSPFVDWKTKQGQVIQHTPKEHIKNILDKGLIPVFHGDVVIDQLKGCSILSGDTIMEVLAEMFSPQIVVFVTNVFGLYTSGTLADEHSDNGLIREVKVTKTGEASCVMMKTGKEASLQEISCSQKEHDVTGGFMTKIRSSIRIAKTGANVYIVKCRSESAENLLNTGKLKLGDRGTHIHCVHSCNLKLPPLTELPEKILKEKLHIKIEDVPEKIKKQFMGVSDRSNWVFVIHCSCITLNSSSLEG